MKQLANQATNQQRLSRIGGDPGRKERMNSQVLTVCFTKGITLMIEIRDYRGGDYEHEKQREKYEARCVFSKNDNHKPNQFNQ